MGESKKKKLQHNLKEAYEIIGKEGFSLLINQFSNLLEEISGPSAKLNFLAYCQEKFQKGEYKIENLKM